MNSEADPYLEAQEFLDKHGVFEIKQRRVDLLGSLSEDEKMRLFEFEKHLCEGESDFENDIKKLPEIERLHGLRQLAGKADPFEPKEFDRVGVIRPSFTTRFDHSELLAELAKFVGIKIGLDFAKIKVMMCAGWMHDMGHPAYSHIGDELLVSKGWTDHEERTRDLLNNEDIRRFLESNQIVRSEFEEILREKGELGVVQSMLDTLSYLILDSGMISRPLYNDNGCDVVSSIIAVKNGRLVVSDTAPFQYLLEARALMSKLVYYHPDNKRTAAAIQQLLRVAMKKGFLEDKQLVTGTDMTISLYLQSLVQHDPGAAMMSGRKDVDPHLKKYKKLFGLSLGFNDRSEWSHNIFESSEELNSFLGTLTPEQIEQSCIVSPYDYTKKKIVVVTIDRGQYIEHELRAKTVKLDNIDTKFILYFPRK